MVSLICPSNNKEKFNNLKKSLESQTYADFELICVDTEELKCNSAVEALNKGIELAKGDTYIFLHNDIEFQNINDLEDIINYIVKIRDFGIIGVAGAKFENVTTIGNIYHGIPKRRISNEEIDKEVDVQTLDECLFVIKKATLDKYPFDKNNKTWHLYAVDYSLYMNTIGKKVAVIPSKIYHVSPGSSINKEYYKELMKICSKYKRMYKTINTPMGFWSTNSIKLFLQIIKNKIKIFFLKQRKEI